MRFVSEIIIDALEVTIPMLADLDDCLRELGSPTDKPPDWYVEGERKLRIKYEFEAEDLWEARFDLEHLEHRLTDVGISEGGVSVRKPAVHPEVKTQLLMTGLSESQATAIGKAAEVIDGIIQSHVQFDIVGMRQHHLSGALRSIISERSPSDG